MISSVISAREVCVKLKALSFLEETNISIHTTQVKYKSVQPLVGMPFDSTYHEP